MDFIRRNGIAIEIPEIRYRYDVPDELRGYLFLLLFQYGLPYKRIRDIVCLSTHEAEDESNWGENNFMKNEIQTHINNCAWYHVYTLIEDFYKVLTTDYKRDFENKINTYFCEKGIGWKLLDGELSVRGDDIFEHDINQVKSTLGEKGLSISSNEIQEAIKDLSKIPTPDITGAIQHSVAALECTSRNITGDTHTLGALISNNPDIVPRPLNEAISKIWGYSSNFGRHLQEGYSPSFEEAELIVHLSASLCNYLCKKYK